VGEKIGKDHLTYGQGAAAEITAMFTIGAADWWGLPVSTNARFIVGRGGDDGGQPHRAAMVHRAESSDGLDFDAACVNYAVGLALLALPQDQRLSDETRFEYARRL
jgi:hypothetical protein